MYPFGSIPAEVQCKRLARIQTYADRIRDNEISRLEADLTRFQLLKEIIEWNCSSTVPSVSSNWFGSVPSVNANINRYGSEMDRYLFGPFLVPV